MRIVSEKMKNGQTKYCLRCGAERGQDPNRCVSWGKFYGRHLFNNLKSNKNG